VINLSEVVLDDDEVVAVNEVLRSGRIAQGPKVFELEQQFANFCGAKHAVAVNSGTAAIHAALYAIGIGEGDEVITTPFTFVATANPILMQRATPVFADIEAKTCTIDPQAIETKITKKTKAIIAVDLFGHPADYDALWKICQKHGLKLIQDAAQSHAAEFRKGKTGTYGDVACFSFYATKNMMCGEGGMVTTDNEEFAELSRQLRHHGQSQKVRYEYHDIGYNYRMTDIHAAIGLQQLRKLEERTKKRIHNATYLSAQLAGISGITVPYTDPRVRHVFHQYTIRCDNTVIDRDRSCA